MVDLLRPIPKEERQGDTLVVDPWGELAPLRLHPEFARLIPVVSGETFSHAMHGYAKPLMEVLITEPRYLLLKIPPAYQVCLLRSHCVMYHKDRCYPSSSKLPECWKPEAEASQAMAIVTLAWAENRHVVIVEGEEFSL